MNITAVVDPRSCELRWRTDNGQTVPGRIRIRATWDYQARRICPGAALRPTAKGERRAGHRTRWRDGQDSNL